MIGVDAIFLFRYRCILYLFEETYAISLHVLPYAAVILPKTCKGILIKNSC